MKWRISNYNRLRFWEAPNLKQWEELTGVDMVFVSGKSSMIRGFINVHRLNFQTYPNRRKFLWITSLACLLLLGTTKASYSMMPMYLFDSLIGKKNWKSWQTTCRCCWRSYGYHYCLEWRNTEQSTYYGKHTHSQGYHGLCDNLWWLNYAA